MCVCVYFFLGGDGVFKGHAVMGVPEWMPVKRYRSARRSKRTRRGKSRTTRPKSFAARVKKALLSKAETKYFDIGLENNQLYHNLGFSASGLPPTTVSSIPGFFNPWARISPGTGREQRIGDKINPTGISLKLYLANKEDRPNTMIRLIVAVLPKTFNGAVVGTQFNPLQIPNSGVLGNTMLYPADKDKGVKFLYDRIIRMSGAQRWNGVKEPTKVVKLWIKRKRSREIVFDTTSVDIVNKPLAVYAIPYEQFSTLTTDNIASIAGYMRMYYKDI